MRQGGTWKSSHVREDDLKHGLCDVRPGILSAVEKRAVWCVPLSCAGLLGCLGLLEQAVHRFSGEELVARFNVVAGTDLECGEQARDFGNWHFFQEDGGGFLDSGEFVFDGDAHGWSWMEMKL